MGTYIVIVKKNGQAIKFNSKEMPKQHPGGLGVKMVQVLKGDAVVSAFAVQEE